MTSQENKYFSLGYSSMLRMHNEALQRGWPAPSERKIVREIFLLEHSAVHSSRDDHALPMLSQQIYPTEWYHGRAAALRKILLELRASQID